MKGCKTILGYDGSFKDNGKPDSVPPPRAISSRTAPGSVRMAGSLSNHKLQVLFNDGVPIKDPAMFTQLINGPFLCLTALALMYFPNRERFRMTITASQSVLISLYGLTRCMISRTLPDVKFLLLERWKTKQKGGPDTWPENGPQQ
jgi:hypothetical protein